MASSAAAAGASKRSRSTSIVRAKDWRLRVFHEFEGDDVVPTLAALAKLKFPFDVTPETTASVPDEYTKGVQFYENTTDPDSVPWTEYYATYHGAHLAVTNVFGVWVEIKKTSKGWRAVRVVRAGIRVSHWPVDGMDVDAFEASGDIIKPPPRAPRPKTSVFKPVSSETESEVEEDDDMKPTRSSQMEHGRGKKPWRPRGTGDDPWTMDDLEDEETNTKPKRLEGQPPKTFNGDRSTTHKFLRDFGRFMDMNIGADIEKDPFKKSAYFLGLIQGPDTEGWADEIDDWFKEVRKDRSTIPRGQDEWDHVEREFKRAFIDYAEHERSNRELNLLKMKENNVDQYIARFKQLARRAGHDVNSPSLMTMFSQGLPQKLADICFDLHDPDTFDEWTRSAQRNHKVWMKKQEAKSSWAGLQNRNERPGNPWGRLQWGTQNRGNQNRGNTGNPMRYTRQDPNAMDTSAVAKKAVTEADKLKHRQEGRCFECSKQGHLARNCPNKTPRLKAASATEEKPEKAATSKIGDLTDGSTLADYAMQLSDEARDTFIKKLMGKGESEEDFVEA